MSTLGRKIGAFLLSAAGVVALATPASADNEQPRLILTWTAKVGAKNVVSWGSCVDEKIKSVTSKGFVGGEARIVRSFYSSWTAEADIVDEPGTYVVTMTCDGNLATSRTFRAVP